MSLLCYRFPREQVVRQSGYFHELPSDIKDYEGFILSNFTKSKRYGFVEFTTASDHPHYIASPIEVIEKAKYLWLGEKLISAIKMTDMSKVVFSRIKAVAFDETKTQALFNSLSTAYPNALVYLISDRILGTWVGASPELLLRTVGEQGFSISLAGTKKSEDKSQWLEKEKIEQDVVSTFIEQKLQELDASDVEMIGPYDYVAGPVKHLRTDFSFRTKREETEVLDALHPTPAVSGLPRTLAMEIIENIEEHDRAIYTGYIGLLSPKDSKIYVNLRCCQIRPGNMYLYLGGGYTKDSNPELEWEETENKSKTLLDLVQKL